MPAPERDAVPTGRVVFTLPVKGSNIDSQIIVTVQPRGGNIPAEHWALADLVWDGVKAWSQALAGYPDVVVFKVGVQRSYEYTVDDAAPDARDMHIAKNVVWPPPPVPVQESEDAGAQEGEQVSQEPV